MKRFMQIATVLGIIAGTAYAGADFEAKRVLTQLPDKFTYASANSGDMDGDGDIDLIVGALDMDLNYGDGAGKIYFFENTAGSGNTPSYAAPKLVTNSSGQAAAVSGSS